MFSGLVDLKAHAAPWMCLIRSSQFANRFQLAPVWTTISKQQLPPLGATALS
jgi:hypothetical protein